MKKAVIGKTVFAVFIAGICIVSLLMDHREIRFLWREWTSSLRHFTYKYKYNITRFPVFSQSVAQQDPEAAAIGEAVMRVYDITSFNEKLDSLSSLALQYPENQFFIYLLKDFLPDLSIEKLHAMDPQNGFYHILNAKHIVQNQGYAGIDCALTELETGLNCPYITMPYEPYYPRVEKLFEDEKIAQSNIWAIIRERSFPGWSLARLSDSIRSYTGYLIINGRIAEAQSINDRLEKCARKSACIPFIISEPGEFLFPQFNINGLDYQPSQFTELQMLSLSPQRARQLRLELLPWKELTAQYWNNSHNLLQNRPTHMNQETKLLFPAAIHGGQMLMASLAGLACFSGLAIWRKTTLHPTGLPTFLILLISGITLLGLTQFWAFLLAFNIDSYLYTFKISLASPYEIINQNNTLSIYRDIEISTAAGLIVLWFIRNTRFGRWLGRKWIWCLLLAGFFGCLTLELSRWGIAFMIPMFLFMVLSTLVLARRKEPVQETCRGTALLCSTEPAALAYRGRCLQIMTDWALLYLVLFTLCTPPLIQAGIEECRISSGAYSASVKPLTLETDEQLYSKMLAHFDKPDLTWSQARKWLPCVMPEDLPKVLEKINKIDSRSFLDSFDQRYNDLEMGGIPGSTTHEDHMNNLKDYEFAKVMEQCGRNAMPYFLPYFKHPDSFFVLYFRCKLGDSTAAEILKSALRKGNITAQEDSTDSTQNDCPDFSSDRAIEALAWAGHYEDAIRFYQDYATEHQDYDLNASDCTLLSLLPDSYRAQLVGWLTQYAVGNQYDRLLADLYILESCYQSQPMLHRSIEAFINSHQYYYLMRCYQKPVIDETSAAFLIRKLESNDSDIQLTCMYLLESAKIELNPELLEKLQHNDNARIRATALKMAAERGLTIKNPGSAGILIQKLVNQSKAKTE